MNDLQLDFLQYFISQWCTAKSSKQSPAIWNHHKSVIRTNNIAEGYHSMMSSNIPRHHPLVSQIIEFFKDQNSLASNKFLSLQNNITTSTQHKSRIKQQSFDLSIALTQEEYANNLVDFKTYFHKLTTIIDGRYDSFVDIVSECDVEDDFITTRKVLSKDIYRNQANPFENVDFLKKLNLPKKRKAKSDKLDTISSKKAKLSKEEKAQEKINRKQSKLVTQKNNLMISRLIKMVPPDHPCDPITWLNDINIDLVLEYFQLKFANTNIKIITLANRATKSSDFNFELTNFESTANLIFVINVMKNHWITLTNIDTQPDGKIYTNANVFMYDSLNNIDYLEGIKPFLSEMYPLTDSYIIHSVKMQYPQISTNDCGLFALAYVHSLCNFYEPSSIKYKQDTMRSNYNKWIETDLEYIVDTDFNITDGISRDAIAYLVTL